MKKLKSANNLNRNTIEAYACACAYGGCMCGYGCDCTYVCTSSTAQATTFYYVHLSNGNTSGGRLSEASENALYA
jgi:hypothetical protein